jgi:hypothetical protein
MDKEMTHTHDQVSVNPIDGDKFTCHCGVKMEFVKLDDGLPGEWVDTTWVNAARESKHETCRVCGNPVRLMCQQGTDYCSQLCENEGNRNG